MQDVYTYKYKSCQTRAYKRFILQVHSVCYYFNVNDLRQYSRETTPKSQFDKLSQHAFLGKPSMFCGTFTFTFMLPFLCIQMAFCQLLSLYCGLFQFGGGLPVNMHFQDSSDTTPVDVTAMNPTNVNIVNGLLYTSIEITW